MPDAPCSRASFDWQADYGQFYLADARDDSFRPPQAFTDAMEEDSLFVSPAGLVIYMSSGAAEAPTFPGP